MYKERDDILNITGYRPFSSLELICLLLLNITIGDNDRKSYKVYRGYSR